MINGIIYLILLLSIAIQQPANATTQICQEVAAELTLAKDHLDITDEEIRELYEKCLTVEGWGTYS